jgi:Ca2+-binding RTX toxin-like protein
MPGKHRQGLRGRGVTAALTLLAALLVASAAGLVVASGSTKSHVISGTKHADHLVGTRGGDVIKGGGGFDRIDGKGGADTLIGGPGGAVLVGGPGRDEFNAVNGKPVDGQGHDVIRARDGTPDVINCGPGKDVAYVDRSEDGVFDCERVIKPTSGQKRGER